MKTVKKRTKHKLGAALTALPFLLAGRASAAGLNDSPLVRGLTNLLNDGSTILMILGPIAGSVFAAGFLIRRAMADEHDGKMWMHRVYIAVGCGIGVLMVSGMVKILSSYFV